MLLLAAVIVLAAAACGSTSHRSGRPGASSTTGSGPGASSTTTTTSTLPASTATTRPGNPDGPVVVPDGAVLSAPSPLPPPVAYPRGSACTALPDAGPPGGPATCGAPAAGTGTTGSPGLAWVLAPSGQGGRTVTVYRVVDGEAYAVLTASDPDGTAWASVTPVDVTLSGLPGIALAVGFRSGGSAGQLQLDVVGGDGTVVFHREVDQGQAIFSHGQEQDWAARYGPDDPNCCPSAYEHSVVRFANGNWRVVIDEMVPPDQVPKGQFP